MKKETKTIITDQDIKFTPFDYSSKIKIGGFLIEDIGDGYFEVSSECKGYSKIKQTATITGGDLESYLSLIFSTPKKIKREHENLTYEMEFIETKFESKNPF